MSAKGISNNLTPRAQQAILLARREAEALHHNFVGSEHLLLGLFKLGQGVAVTVLPKLGLDLETVRAEVARQTGAAANPPNVVELHYTPGFKKILAMAGEEAKALNHRYVGTEHLLLALLHDGEGMAAQVVTSLGVDAAEARRAMLTELAPIFPQGGPGALDKPT